MTVIVATVLVTAVFIRVTLDWSDSMPYAGDVTERRYILLAVIAILIFTSGCVLSVIVFKKLGKRK